MLTGWLNSVRSMTSHNIGKNVYSHIFIQTRDYAARKGTREKARLKKIKINLEKASKEAEKIRKKAKVKATSSPLVLIDKDLSLKTTTDNVWVIKNHPLPIYSLKQAIECHRETHHPTMFNVPDALVNVFVELNMKFDNRNKYIDKFTKIVDLPHAFDTGAKKPTILALSKNSEEQNNAVSAGADYVGGVEVIKQIQGGKFEYKEYDYIIANIDILTELLLVRGLLRRKFPSAKIGTLSNDVGKLVTKFKNAIKYSAIPDKDHKDYAQIHMPFGKLDMDVTQLEENFATVLRNIESASEKRISSFIKRVQIKSAPSEESFKVDFNTYLQKKVEEDTEEELDNSAVIESH